jgi:hypothetical protein
MVRSYSCVYLQRIFLQCLQIERMPLNSERLRLPRELLDCCAAAVACPNMSKQLISAMQRKSIE